MRLLVVENNQELNRQLRTALRGQNYVVDTAFDGEEGHFLGDTEPYDLVVLDLGLPIRDGGSVLRQWRHAGHNFPVLILTARDQWSEKVAGFDAGADDYLTKPFHMEELLARVRALLRRSVGQVNDRIEIGALVFDSRTAQVYAGNQKVNLTSHEYRLLAYMAAHQERVLSRTELSEHIYDQSFDLDSNTIEVFIGRLRKKIGAQYILTRRGLGYQLVNPVPSSKV